MASKNDITGDEIKSTYGTEMYRQNWDNIFTNNKVETATKPLKPLLSEGLNVADLKDRLAFLDQEAFRYDKATNEFLGAPGTCPPPASVYVWVDGRGACKIKDLIFDPQLGIMINLND